MNQQPAPDILRRISGKANWFRTTGFINCFIFQWQHGYLASGRKKRDAG